MSWVKDFVLGVRRIRSEMNVRPGVELNVLLDGGSAEDDARAARHHRYLTSLAGLGRITRVAPGKPVQQAAKALLGRLEILIPLEGLIDIEAERTRIDKELARLHKELTRSESKLGSENFVARAPAAVVDKERARVAGFKDALARLQSQRAALQG
jgi:valyl-tRNA synthetase